MPKRSPEAEKAHPRTKYKRPIGDLLKEIKSQQKEIRRYEEAAERFEKLRMEYVQARKQGRSVTINRLGMLAVGLPGAPLMSIASSRPEDQNLEVEPRDIPKLLHNLNGILEIHEYQRALIRRRLFGLLYEYRERMPVHHLAIRMARKTKQKIIRKLTQRRK